MGQDYSRRQQIFQDCGEIRAVHPAVGKCSPKAEPDDPRGIVGLVVGARDNELRHSRGNAFRGGSYSAMMY